MKICPFISHMLGEDQAGVLEIQDQPGRASAADKTGGKDGARNAAAAAKHLFCLKDTCRFYRKQDADCSFDVVFERVEAQAKAENMTAATRETLDNVNHELGKFWALQTKSVSELIESIGESEKHSTEALARLEGDVAKKLDDLLAARGSEHFDAILEEISRLHEATQSREEGMEELSSTVSQMVMTFEDRLNELRTRAAELAERIDSLESSQPSGDDIRTWIQEAFASTADSGVSDGLKTIREQFESFVDSSARFEEKVDEWQHRIDTRVEEIRDGQQAWTSSLEELAARKPAEAADDEGMVERRKKARKLNNLGVTSFHNGELELALDQFTQAVALDEGFAECFNNLGLLYTELGHEEKATGAFSAAIKINPDLHAAYNNLGYVFYKQGSYDQAIEMYNEALGRSASNSSAYTNLGNAYFKQDRREDARKAWEKALELDPSNRQASRSLKEMERETV